MALQSLRLRELGAFEDATFEFCPGLNVIIGENATGKSHAMKAAYAVLRSAPRRATKFRASEASFRLADRLRGVFRPVGDDIGRLVRFGGSNGRTTINVVAGDMHLEAWWDRGAEIQSNMALRVADLSSEAAVFVPSREVLALFEGFIAAYEGRELSLDETYYDLCVALSAAPLRGPRAELAKSLLEPLKDALGGEVRSADGRFYLRQGNVDLEAHLVSEGLRKIASIYQLINNGSLTSGGILFWDEPEASLNPRLIDRVAKFLLTLVGNGVQVIIASHDYLLTNRLSLMAEYGKLPDGATMRFFALSRSAGVGSPVAVEHGDTLADLTNNAVLDEFARFYEDERHLALGDK